MNFLFYVGIIVPTLITIALFLIFIYCWLLQRARKEVLTKKYDPHGKMRILGMSMHPPLPPSFCLLEDVLLSDVGEDNVAYDVSRSPSTQQGWRGRPLYHTYHDSGISAGLSPSQENETRHSLVYRTCPDSGVSGLSLLQAGPATNHVSRSCCHIDELLHRLPQLQQVYEDHVYLDTHEHEGYEQQSSHVMLHQCQVQASIHSNVGVSSGRSVNDPLTPDNYVSAQTHAMTNQLVQFNSRLDDIHTPTSATPGTLQPTTKTFYPDRRADYPQCGHTPFCLDPAVDVRSDQESIVARKERSQPIDRVIVMSPPVTSPPLTQRMSPDPTGHLYGFSVPSSSSFSSSSTTATAAVPLKRFYRDSEVMDVGKVMEVGQVMDIGQLMNRPDSQASLSSTTDSEDSGFRSSYCAAHRKAVLSKQEHPLLKPLRKVKRNRNHSRPSRKAAGISQNHPADIHKLFMTLSAQNLEGHIPNLSVIENSLTSVDVIHRPLPASRQCTNNANGFLNEGHYCTATNKDEVGSAISSPTDSQHSPGRTVWARQSTNDAEVSVKQTIHLTDIGSHLSSSYLSEVVPCSLPHTQAVHETQVVPQGRHTCPPGPAGQAGTDRRLDTYSYSVV